MFLLAVFLKRYRCLRSRLRTEASCQLSRGAHRCPTRLYLTNVLTLTGQTRDTRRFATTNVPTPGYGRDGCETICRDLLLLCPDISPPQSGLHLKFICIC